MDWFYLPYYPVKGNFHSIKVIRNENKITTMSHVDGYWAMTNDKVSILELLSMIELAEGNVYVAGLGLGLITLLIAEKESVTKVTVSEANKEVIDFFNAQGFDTYKITIVNEDWVDHKGVESYDWVMLDYYDALGVEKIKMDFEKFKSNNSGALKLDFFNWHLEHKLEHLSLEQIKRYKHDVFKEDFDCGFIVDALKQIHARRTRNA
jgi:spermidine synthase